MESKPNPPLAVFCVKSGSKYGADYANRLHAMVRRNLGLPHSFHCLTDDANGLDPAIKAAPLPGPDLGGCWNKLWLFSERIAPPHANILYLDLDVVLVGPIDDLVTMRPNDDFVGQPDWNRPLFPQFNSSVMRMCAGAHREVLDRFLSELSAGRIVRREEWDATLQSRDKVVYWRGWRRFGGDQEWITAYLRPRLKVHRRAFPQGWIISYKRHGRRKLPVGARAVVFHGSPKPHEVNDDYVREHWH